MHHAGFAVRITEAWGIIVLREIPSRFVRRHRLRIYRAGRVVHKKSISSPGRQFNRTPTPRGRVGKVV